MSDVNNEKYCRNTSLEKGISNMSFAKSIQPRNTNEPANACSKACENKTKEVAKINFDKNHETYRSEHSLGC